MSTFSLEIRNFLTSSEIKIISVGVKRAVKPRGSNT